MDCQYEEKAMSHTAEEIDKSVDQSAANASEIFALKEYALNIINNKLENKAEKKEVETLQQQVSSINDAFKLVE